MINKISKDFNIPKRLAAMIALIFISQKQYPIVAHPAQDMGRALAGDTLKQVIIIRANEEKNKYSKMLQNI